jgi:hypothetical protein
MYELSQRPRLISFRVEAFHSDNRTEGNGTSWQLELNQEIQVGLAVPDQQGAPLQAFVKIELLANAHSDAAPIQTAQFKGEYMGKFNCPSNMTESEMGPLIDKEPFQYMLVSQVFPMAMVHFKRELQATGFDGRQLPFGI